MKVQVHGIYSVPELWKAKMVSAKGVSPKLNYSNRSHPLLRKYRKIQLKPPITTSSEWLTSTSKVARLSLVRWQRRRRPKLRLAKTKSQTPPRPKARKMKSQHLRSFKSGMKRKRNAKTPTLRLRATGTLSIQTPSSSAHARIHSRSHLSVSWPQ